MNGLLCTKCGKHNVSTYEDGTAFCFTAECNTFYKKGAYGNEEEPAPRIKTSTSTSTAFAPPVDIPQRGLKKSTLEYFGVGVIYGESSGEIEELSYPVYRGDLVGRKRKNLNTKEYFAEGSTKNPDLFGMHKVQEGGRLLIITEGEDDCMAAYQMLQEQGKAYNVVSLPNGANTRAIRSSLDKLETFESIILNFDGDEVGKKAALEVAEILTPGKVKIASLPTKDANELLLTGAKASKDYLQAIYKAKPYRPDGVVNLGDAWDAMWEDENTQSVPYPWEGLNKKLYGLREREILTITSGTGSGKSQTVRELEHHLLKNTEGNIGILALEEGLGKTQWGIVSVEASLPLMIREERSSVSKVDIREWWNNTIGTNRVVALDHFGSTSEDNLINRVRYMIKGLSCRWIILDHLSIVVSSMEGGDERRTIDSIMTRLRQLVEETGAGMILIVHLRRAGGDKGHEQGIEVSLSHLRGSQSIAQLSDSVIALERNQQAIDDREANLTTVRVLKNRYAGITGLATHLSYDSSTGRMSEVLNVDEYLYPEED